MLHTSALTLFLDGAPLLTLPPSGWPRARCSP